MLVYQRVNLHFPMVFLCWITCRLRPVAVHSGWRQGDGRSECIGLKWSRPIDPGPRVSCVNESIWGKTMEQYGIYIYISSIYYSYIIHITGSILFILYYSYIIHISLIYHSHERMIWHDLTWSNRSLLHLLDIDINHGFAPWIPMKFSVSCPQSGGVAV